MNLKDIIIRETQASDFDDIMRVETQAFGYDKEAKLTAGLLSDKTAEPMVSLLAFYEGEAVGHVLFTRAYLEGQPDMLAHILAPLAVKPEYQRKGVGGMLIKAGIELLRKMDSNLVFVFGSDGYYPKFGFITCAIDLGYPPPYAMPDDFAKYWMVQPIGKNGFDVAKGRVICSDELNKPEHWRDDESDR